MVTQTGIPITEFTDVEYLQRVVIHLYDLLDDVDTADDMAKSDDAFYRGIVGRIQERKCESGVNSLDGYTLQIEPCDFKTKDD